VVSKLFLRIEKELGKSTSNISVNNECRTKLNIGNNMQKYANMSTCKTLSLLAKKSVSL